MTDEVQDLFYIQLTSLNLSKDEYTYQVEIGNLWEKKLSNFQLSVRNHHDSTDIKLSINSELIASNKQTFVSISYEVHQLLVAIPECANRLRVFKDNLWLNEGLSIAQGSEVVILDQNSKYDMYGVVKYIGAVSKYRGTYFGIELDQQFEGNGSSNGTFQKRTYFVCSEDCAVFVALHRVRLKCSYRTVVPSQTASSMESRSMIEISIHSNKELQSRNANCPSLKDSAKDYVCSINDRVVWVSDEGPEYGIVKWIGALPETPGQDTVVGVEFDNPIGRGTGQYKLHKLFDAKRDHASIVPILGLISAKDFEDSDTSNNDRNMYSSRASFGKSYVPSNSTDEFNISEFVKNEVRVGSVKPWLLAIEELCGRRKGIQSEMNSSGTTEAVLFAMFMIYDYFDIYKVNSKSAVDMVDKFLREEIINPLRCRVFVRSSEVQRFRELLGYMISSSTKMCSPYDVINCVLGDVIRLKPLITFTSGESFYVYVVPHVETHRSYLSVPSIQHLLEYAVLQSNHRLESFPNSVLILDFSSVSPHQSCIQLSEVIDISCLLESFPRECKICGAVGELECADCFTTGDIKRYNDVIFCKLCFDQYHMNVSRSCHLRYKVLVPPQVSDHCNVVMELFSVISLIDDHFVSFVKYPSCVGSVWLMHDSNVTRHSDSEEIIPEIRRSPEVEEYFAAFEQRRISDLSLLPPIVKQMITGLCVCFYHKSMQ